MVVNEVGEISNQVVKVGVRSLFSGPPGHVRNVSAHARSDLRRVTLRAYDRGRFPKVRYEHGGQPGVHP